MKKAIKILAATILSALFITAAHFSAVQIRTNADRYPDDTLTEETAVQSALNTPPAVIADVTSADILESLKSGDKPVQAILTIGADGRVKGADGEDICDLSVALDKYLQKTILPVFRVDDSSADILLNWFKTDRRITDASVSSSSPEAVKKIKTVYPALRGIVEFDESADIKKAAATANAACAQICILPESAASYDAVRYVQARFKTVWVRAEKNDRISIKNCVASGCFGVIAEDVSLSCATLKEYAGGIVRTPYNVAHRGLPNKYNENSVSGTLAAIRAGATHVELDCYLTQDNEIFVVFHGYQHRKSVRVYGMIVRIGNGRGDEFHIRKKFRFRFFRHAVVVEIHFAVYGDVLNYAFGGKFFKNFKEKIIRIEVIHQHGKMFFLVYVVRRGVRFGIARLNAVFVKRGGGADGNFVFHFRAVEFFVFISEKAE